MPFQSWFGGAFGFTLIFSTLSSADSQSFQPSRESHCTYTREYITALEYLRSNSGLSIPETDARRMAENVALGCTGAAQRFIKIVSTLADAKLSSRDSIQMGIEFTQRTDIETESFVTIFLTAYLPEHLDMDLLSSMTLARSLSTEFKGDILKVRDDFEALVRFCVNPNRLGLSRPQCAALAARITQRGEALQGGVAEPWITLYAFLTNEAGPHLTAAQAIDLSEKLIAGGMDTCDNFIQGFKYATAHKGLDLSAQEAVAFAQKIAFPKESPGHP